MIYIINYDIKQTELNKLINTNIEKITINCLDYNYKQLDSILHNTLGIEDLFKSNNVYIISNTYIINNNLFNTIFKYKYRNIYIINVSHKQEKFLYKNFRNKYKYVNCKYDKSLDNIILPYKKILFLKENREILFNNNKSNIKYILKFLSYNLPFTDLDLENKIKNYEFIMNLEKYCYKIDEKYIKVNLIKNLIIPNFGIIVDLPSSKTKKNKNKKKKKNDNISQKDLRKLAKEKMKIYMKNRNALFFEKINNDKNKGFGLL